MENESVVPVAQPPVSSVPPVPSLEKLPVVVISTPQVPGMQSMPYGATGIVPPQGEPPAPHKSRGWTKYLIGFVCLIVVLGGAYYAYAYVYNSPGRVLGMWQSKGVAAAAGQYHVNGKVSISATIGKTPGTLSLTTSSDVDAKDASNPLSKSTISYSSNYGGFQSSVSGVQVLEIGKVFYVNLSSISAFTSELDPKYNGWVKIDENELAQYEAANGNSAGASALTNASTSPDIQKLQQLLTSANVVSGYKTDGRESIDGSETYHYSLTIDKSKLKSAMDQALGLYNVTSDEQASFDSFIDGATVSKSDVWIGVFDHQLHKVDIQLMLPVPSALAALGGNSSEATVSGSAADVQRLADAREIASASELYYNDHGGYPATLQAEVPAYLGAIPVAPATQGPCATTENTYTYTPSGTPNLSTENTDSGEVYQSYTLTFCINQPAGGYPAGQMQLTPEGIKSVASSDFAARPTPATTPAPSPTTANTVIVELTADTSALAQPPVVTAPASSDDIISQLTAASPPIVNVQSDRDQQRLADIRRMQAGLELYFGNHGGYPPTLEAATPVDILDSVPVAPTPADGTCTDEQNTYWYRPGGTPKTVSGAQVYPSYLLGYCLGSSAGGMSAGYHDASSPGAPQ